MALRWFCAVLLALPGVWGDCGWPPRFDFAEAPVPLKESYAVGTVLNYKCRPGYTMARDKLPHVTCLSYSNWSSDSDFCIGKSCGPPDIANGIFHYTTDLLFGATITYTCNVGYRLVGKQSARCELKNNEVSWDNTPYCAIIPCLPPPEIKNGQLISRDRDFTFGMAVTYSCNKGFALIGDATIHCTMDGEFQGIWSSPAPECKVVRCKNPEVKNGRRLSGLGTEHTYENTVAFECNPGYLLNGSSVVTCEADNTWKPPLPTCDPIYCGPAPHFPFAELTRAVGDSSLAGTTLTYRCKPGYTTANGKSSVVTCLSDRTWSADPDFCIRQQCTPPTIENGDVIAENFLFETVVTFICHPGYELKVSSTAKCVVLGDGVDWDTASPYCERQLPDVLCEEPPTIANGMHNGTKGANFVHGSTVAYKCKDGFTLAGPTFLQCMAGDQYQGVWSKPTPECRGGANLIIVGIFPLLLAMLVMNV
ncbi:complement receptor type 1 [Grus japonensis]|uniref:Complement receptor type 1 n=1 Tax=Grus japonensis TaxID=30415 RepID=A0ABC9XQR3_GRUJA